MIFALRILIIFTLSFLASAKGNATSAPFAILPQQSVHHSGAGTKPSFYYQSLAFERKETYDASWAKPFYTLLRKVGYRMKNFKFENGITTYCAEDRIDSQPFFEIGVTLKTEHPNIDVKSFSRTVIKGYAATYVAKVKKPTSTLPNLCKIPHEMRKSIREAGEMSEYAIDEHSRAIFRPFALPVSNGAFFSFVEEAEVTADGVWIAAIQLCTKHKGIDGQFVDDKIGKAVNSGSKIHNTPWISASVKILGHNPHGYLSADLLWAVPFDMTMVAAAVVMSVVFSALMATHRKSMLRYHWILLVCAFLSTAYVASHLRSDIASNMLAKNHFAHNPLAAEKADAILRTALATALRFALGLFALGYAHLDAPSRDNRSLVIMCAILTAYACCFAVWQLSFERVTSFSTITPWMFACALVDASYMYYLLEHALTLMQQQKKEQQFAKLGLYKRVAALIVVVVVCQALAIAVRVAVPFERLSLRPNCWPICMILGPCYDTLLLFFAMSAALLLLRPNKHSHLYRESREVPTTGEPSHPIFKLPKEYHDDYHCMA